MKPSNFSVEMPSGEIYDGGYVLDVEDELIAILKKHGLLVCDAKAILAAAQERIDTLVRL